MSKHNTKGIIHRISKYTEMPADMLGASPIFHLYSDNELVTEGAADVLHYDKGSVEIYCAKRKIRIIGNNLSLKFLVNKNLSVCGEISSVNIDTKINEQGSDMGVPIFNGQYKV